jgi:hypothetical protein
VTIPRLAAIAFIYVACALAWFGLGTSIVVRTGEHDQKLAKEVELLWGGPQVQTAPNAWVERQREATEVVDSRDGATGAISSRQVTKTVVDRVPAPLLSTRANVALDLDHRRKGLLWYDTYGVEFRAEYAFRNPDDVARPLVVHFTFPGASAMYDAFELTLDGQAAPEVADLSEGATARATVAPGGKAVLKVAYKSRGLGSWTYKFGGGDVTHVRDLALTMVTDFRDVDYPAGSMSPTTAVRAGDGWTLTWRFANLVTGQRIGLDLPNLPNPGPLASRITFFAPVSLLFFFTVLVMVGVTTGANLHPMNYFFLGAAFFAFHLLLAYLVDHVSVQAAFVVSALTSLALVVSYLRVVTGMRRALLQAGAAQVVFLVLFSYAFFFEGYTGLSVTAGAIVTLFALMQMTARVSWSDVFASAPRRSSAAMSPTAGASEARPR